MDSQSAFVSGPALPGAPRARSATTTPRAVPTMMSPQERSARRYRFKVALAVLVAQRRARRAGGGAVPPPVANAANAANPATSTSIAVNVPLGPTATDTAFAAGERAERRRRADLVALIDSDNKKRAWDQEMSAMRTNKTKREVLAEEQARVAAEKDARDLIGTPSAEVPVIPRVVPSVPAAQFENAVVKAVEKALPNQKATTKRNVVSDFLATLTRKGPEAGTGRDLTAAARDAPEDAPVDLGAGVRAAKPEDSSKTVAVRPGVVFGTKMLTRGDVLDALKGAEAQSSFRGNNAASKPLTRGEVLDALKKAEDQTATLGSRGSRMMTRGDVLDALKSGGGSGSASSTSSSSVSSSIVSSGTGQSTALPEARSRMMSRGEVLDALKSAEDTAGVGGAQAVPANAPVVPPTRKPLSTQVPYEAVDYADEAFDTRSKMLTRGEVLEALSKAENRANEFGRAGKKMLVRGDVLDALKDAGRPNVQPGYTRSKMLTRGEVLDALRFAEEDRGERGIRGSRMMTRGDVLDAIDRGQAQQTAMVGAIEPTNPTSGRPRMMMSRGDVLEAMKTPAPQGAVPSSSEYLAYLDDDVQEVGQQDLPYSPPARSTPEIGNQPGYLDYLTGSSAATEVAPAAEASSKILSRAEVLERLRIESANSSGGSSMSATEVVDAKAKSLSRGDVLEALKSNLSTTEVPVVSGPNAVTDDLRDLVESGNVRNLTTTKLRRILAEKDMKTTGRKSDLIARLTSFVRSS